MEKYRLRARMACVKPNGRAPYTRIEEGKWWAVTGSNRRPSRCKRDALPAELTAPQALRSNASVWEMQKKTSAIAMMADARKEDLVYGVFKRFTGLEFWLVRRSDLNCFAGPRIASRRCFAMRNRKRPESDKANFALIFQRSGNIVENTIDGTGRVNFGQPGILGNLPHEIIFVHGNPS
jgi:hypothetical protein